MIKLPEKPEMIPTRDGYGRGVVDAGEKDERVVVLCADLFESTRSQWFQEKFPERPCFLEKLDWNGCLG